MHESLQHSPRFCIGCHVESVQAITYSLDSPPIAVCAGASPRQVCVAGPPTLISNIQQPRSKRSCNESGRGGGVVLERWGDLLLRLVVASEAVDAGLDENETELGVLVLAVGLEVLADGDGLLDEVPEVLRDRRRETCPTVTKTQSASTIPSSK